MPCASCDDWIQGWATYELGGDGAWRAYCSDCAMAPGSMADADEPGNRRAAWVKRAQCCICNDPTQSCSGVGSIPMYCLRANGWQRSGTGRRGADRKWYCPTHARQWLTNDPFDRSFVFCQCGAAS